MDCILPAVVVNIVEGTAGFFNAISFGKHSGTRSPVGQELFSETAVNHNDDDTINGGLGCVQIK
jgi:hypothetical protein